MKKYFKQIKIALIIFSLLLISIPFLPTTETTTEKLSESRQLSGVFTVPAGKGPWESKIDVKKSEFFWVASSSSIKILDCKNGQTVTITNKGWMSQRPATKVGYLTFIKKNKPVKIDFKIIN